MSLVELWTKSKEEFSTKTVQQMIVLAGDGNLKDGSITSNEFRAFLSDIPTDFIETYAEQCLQESFSGSGFALQDIVNQIGQRLGFKVKYGRYRGVSGQIGYDGIWELPTGHSIIIEVKTTDAYRIDLDKLAKYRKELIKQGAISEDKSSVLIIAGRTDTGDLEAQIRGSRHAWDMRMISVDALLRLMDLKQQVEDPATIHKISDILVPREFTKLDEIVEIVFFTAEDIKEEEPTEEDEENDEIGDIDKTKEPKFKPVAFHQKCVDRIEQYLNRTLVKQTRNQYLSSDGSLAIICVVSKEYTKGVRRGYWFGFHPYHKEFLQSAKESYLSLGCGSAELILLIPSQDFIEWLEGFNITQKVDNFFWHIHIEAENEKLILTRKTGYNSIDVTKYTLSK